MISLSSTSVEDMMYRIKKRPISSPRCLICLLSSVLSFAIVQPSIALLSQESNVVRGYRNLSQIIVSASKASVITDDTGMLNSQSDADSPLQNVLTQRSDIEKGTTNQKNTKVRGLAHYLRIVQKSSSRRQLSQLGGPLLPQRKEVSESRKDKYHLQHLKSATELFNKPVDTAPPAPGYRYIFLDSHGDFSRR